MKKIKRMILSPAGSLVMFALAVVLLLSSGITGTRAALTYFSETYASRVQMYDIGVALRENEQQVSWRNYRNDLADGRWDEETGRLLEHMLDEEPDGRLKLGKNYKEELDVQNTGTINQYVRVTIYKYWTEQVEQDGETTYERTDRSRDLSPELIDLHLLCDTDDTVEGWNCSATDSGWMLDREATTAERAVLYYRWLLYADDSGERNGEVSNDFADTLKLDSLLGRKVTQKTEQKDGKTITTITYNYDGVLFQIEAEVDAVQEHKAEDAVWSAWGRKVTVDNGVLSLEE